MRWLYSIANSMDMNLGKLREMVRDREVWHATVHGIVKSRTQLLRLSTRMHSARYRRNKDADTDPLPLRQSV